MRHLSLLTLIVLLTCCNKSADPLPSDPPSNLTANAVSYKQINLKWDDKATNETGYKVERKTGMGAFSLIATLGADINSYIDTGLTESTIYTYRVFPFNTNGNGAYSNEAFDTTFADLFTGLVAYYPFSGNAGDSSGYNNHGTVNGAVLATDRFGNPGSAYSFNGVDNYISLPKQFNQGQSLPEFTISVWFYRTTASDGIIWAKSGYWKEVVLSTTASNNIGFYYAYPNPQAYYNIPAPLNFNLNRWNNITIVQKNSQFYSYLNGTLVNTGAANAMTNWAQDSDGCSTGQNFIGMGKYCQANITQPFNGKIDELRLYNRALTQTQIAYLAAH